MGIQAMRRRHFPKREKGLPKGYDSGLEVRLHEGPLKDALHHPVKVGYVWEHTYEPDFLWEKDGVVYLVEAKGRFRDRAEATKYIKVRESLPEGYELIFIFQNPNTAFPHAKTRRDGTKMTHGEWAEKNGFRYWSEEEVNGYGAG